MSEDLFPNRLSELVARHPRLFRGEAPQWATVPPGWFALVDKLCFDLEALGESGRELPLQVERITEKFGSMRFSLTPLRGLAAPALGEQAQEMIWAVREATPRLCPGCGADTSQRRTPMLNLCPACKALVDQAAQKASGCCCSSIASSRTFAAPH